uniref:Uncharacterized protein n=1 Tax=Arundo donax TaxID=35708 RepID=A0A0A9B651_ARUDO
MVALACRRV